MLENGTSHTQFKRDIISKSLTPLSVSSCLSTVTGQVLSLLTRVLKSHIKIKKSRMETLLRTNNIKRRKKINYFETEYTYRS